MVCGKESLGVFPESAIEQAKLLAEEHNTTYVVYLCSKCEHYHILENMKANPQAIKYVALVSGIKRESVKCCSSCAHMKERWSGYHECGRNYADHECGRDYADITPSNICDEHEQLNTLRLEEVPKIGKGKLSYTECCYGCRHCEKFITDDEASEETFVCSKGAPLPVLGVVKSVVEAQRLLSDWIATNTVEPHNICANFSKIESVSATDKKA